MQILPQSMKGLYLSMGSTNIMPKLNSLIMRTFLLPLLMLMALSIQAEDEVVAGFHCPPHAYADCHDELWDLGNYGSAYFVDYNGNNHYAGAPVVTYHLSNCNTGSIHRTWNYQDPYSHWHSCTQIIHVSGGGFNSYSIVWPKDIDLEGCDNDIDPNSLPYENGKPTYQYQECSNIAYNYTDDVFYFGGDCRKIRRTWTLIDWCEYEPNTYNSGGIWTHVQIIKITNDHAPDLYCPAGVKIPSFDCDSAYVNLTPVTADYSVCGGQFQITNNSPYADSNGADASGTYPIGLHNITFSIKYGCFTNTTCSVQVLVEDGKNPVPYCYGQLAVALMPMDDNGDGVPEDGMVQIWASDLNKDSFHPCGYGPLKFSFSEDPNDTHKTFTCADVGKNDVRMYVTGPYGGQSFCIVEVDVQNNGANIPDCTPTPENNTGYTGTVSGRVLNPDYTPLPDTKIMLEGGEPEISITENLIDVQYLPVEVNSYNTPLGNTVHVMGQDTIETYAYDTTVVMFQEAIMTNPQGQFTHNNVMTNEMVKMMLEKNTADVSKINLDDAKVLHAFITGTTTFNHPYLYLAADLDDNMKVDFDDLLHMIKFVSGEVYALPTSEPYWFVDELDNQNDPFDLAIMDPVEMTLSDFGTEDFNLLAIMKGNLDVLLDGPELQEILDNSSLEIGLISDVDDLLENDDTVVTLRPNPAIDFTNISLEGKSLKGNYRLSVYDASGKTVYESSNTATNKAMNFEIDVTAFTSGYYFYNIQGESKSYKGSFIRN